MNTVQKIKFKKKIKINFRKWSPFSIRFLNFIKNILDPELPKTLIFLKVMFLEGIFIKNFKSCPFLAFRIWIVPTSEKCSMSSLIGIYLENIFLQKPIQENLNFFLPKNWNWKFSFEIPSFSHYKSESYTKQLNDKERISAAFENRGVRGTVNRSYIKKNIF
ncbi:hypothetical protein HAN_1g169 (nucleomorph) [Hemiselmis andersenii]|uniref:Uncharacterized protein n=1 Tax=Hemiselmis andersenii TaxID=464988 RepID=A9BKH1_HEMAN|nr:hypothetical protein HAN_1g169 [Hemiselmis andersenii]ABW98004.1 hypothetical protein HAN_1g169 [Hemiselmis andersenii]